MEDLRSGRIEDFVDSAIALDSVVSVVSFVFATVVSFVFVAVVSFDSVDSAGSVDSVAVVSTVEDDNEPELILLFEIISEAGLVT